MKLLTKLRNHQVLVFVLAKQTMPNFLPMLPSIALVLLLYLAAAATIITATAPPAASAGGELAATLSVRAVQVPQRAHDLLRLLAARAHPQHLRVLWR